MKINTFLFATLCCSLFFISCSKDDDPQTETPLGNYDNGTLILNQGGYGHGDATVSYLSEDFTTTQNNIFSLVNPAITLGDTGQDIGLYQNLAFIVLNVSNKIEVVNRYTMAHVATISTGLDNPRYIAFSNGQGYVTNWGDGTNPADDYIAVINLSSNTITNTISVAEGPERIVAYNNKLYVAQTGGYGYGNTVSVINLSSNTVETTISVGDVPNSLKVNDGSLYVLCGGKPSWSGTETAGKFVKINLTTNAVATSIDFPVATHPSNLYIADNSFYYTVDSAIFKSTLNTSILPTTALFSTTAQGVYGIYSFAINNNKIYVGDAGDYNSNGKIYIYSTTGILEHSYTVGVIPAGFYFN